MTLLQLLKEIRDMGPAGDRLRKVKCGEIEIELDAPTDTTPKTLELKLPESQIHGDGLDEKEVRIREEAEALGILYGAGAGRSVPSDFV